MLNLQLSWAKSRHFSCVQSIFSKRFVPSLTPRNLARAAFSLKNRIFPECFLKKGCQNIVFGLEYPKKNLKIFWQLIYSYFAGLFLLFNNLFLVPSLLVHVVSRLSFRCGWLDLVVATNFSRPSPQNYFVSIKDLCFHWPRQLFTKASFLFWRQKVTP